MDQPDKMERIAARLQNKIAQFAAKYELQIVMLEDEIDDLKAKLKEKDAETEV